MIQSGGTTRLNRNENIFHHPAGLFGESKPNEHRQLWVQQPETALSFLLRRCKVVFKCSRHPPRRLRVGVEPQFSEAFTGHFDFLFGKETGPFILDNKCLHGPVQPTQLPWFCQSFRMFGRAQTTLVIHHCE